MQDIPLVRSCMVALVAGLAVGSASAQSTAAPASAPQAVPAPEASPFTANLNLTTKYKFRGQDQGNTRFFSPALQGGFDWSSNGFYLGNWNSNVSFSDANLEMDFYAGYKGEIGGGFGYDVGILQYHYPQKDRTVNFDTTEVYGALSYDWLTSKASLTVSKDYFGIGEAQQAGGADPRPSGRGTLYLELNANYALVEKLTLNAHGGYTRYASDLRAADGLGVPNFYDYKIGVTYDLGSGFSVAGAVVGASRKSFYGDINKTRAIFTIGKAL